VKVSSRNASGSSSLTGIATSVYAPRIRRDYGATTAVTSVVAKYLRQQDNLGSIAPGRYADLLVVDGDLLRDPREIRKLTTVCRGGAAHDPQKLLTQVPKSEVARSH